MNRELSSNSEALNYMLRHRCHEVAECYRRTPVEAVERPGTGPRRRVNPSRRREALRPKTYGSKLVRPGRRPVENGDGFKPYAPVLKNGCKIEKFYVRNPNTEPTNFMAKNLQSEKSLSESV
jgi:hypothetical protein